MPAQPLLRTPIRMSFGVGESSKPCSCCTAVGVCRVESGHAAFSKRFTANLGRSQADSVDRLTSMMAALAALISLLGGLEDGDALVVAFVLVELELGTASDNLDDVDDDGSELGWTAAGGGIIGLKPADGPSRLLLVLLCDCRLSTAASLIVLLV